MVVDISALVAATVMPAVAALRLLDHHGRLKGFTYSVVAWVVIAAWWCVFLLFAAATGLFGGRGWVG